MSDTSNMPFGILLFLIFLLKKLFSALWRGGRVGGGGACPILVKADLEFTTGWHHSLTATLLLQAAEITGVSHHTQLWYFV